VAKGGDGVGGFGRLPEPAVWLGVGELRHARLAPLRHAFAYRAQWLRVRLDAAADGGAVRTANAGLARNRFGLVALHDADYGFAADAGRPLRDQARAALAAAGIDDADGAIWLHSFPRVLGYAFNPVSFFFCHRADGGLRAVIAEVNNTFGERHRYVLAHADGRVIRDGEWLRADKRFAVSPFFGGDGEYRFRFGFRRGGGGDAAGDGAGLVAVAPVAGTAVSASCVRIELHLDGRPALIASLGGRYTPASPARLALAVLRQPFWTLAVFVRIHVQALALWRRGLPIVSRPPSKPRSGIPR